MCEHRSLKIKRDGIRARRANRRLQRVARVTTPPIPSPSPSSVSSVISGSGGSTTDTSTPSLGHTSSDSDCSATPIMRPQQELVNIALRTYELIRRNRVIEQRLEELRRETNDFIISVMNNPENRRIFGDNPNIESLFNYDGSRKHPPANGNNPK